MKGILLSLLLLFIHITEKGDILYVIHTGFIIVSSYVMLNLLLNISFFHNLVYYVVFKSLKIHFL